MRDNDEVSFLSDDAGRLLPAGTPFPSGVTAAAPGRVTVNDPLDPSAIGYVYLFASLTLTGGGAGTTGLGFTLSLDSGHYEQTYKKGVGAQAPNNVFGTNPEHSTIVTPAHTVGFGDRSLNDRLRITVGGSSGVNVLERARIQFTPTFCGRTEDTMDGAVPNARHRRTKVRSSST